MKSDFIKNWDTQLKKGLLPYFVLESLYKREYYGYELIQVLKEEYEIEVTESTMYPLLIRLMNEELLKHSWIEQNSGIPRKYYFISTQGKTVFKEMKNNIKGIFSKIIK